MPRGVARDPAADKRRSSKAGGRPKTLPPGTVMRAYRATPAEHAAIKEYLRRIRVEPV